MRHPFALPAPRVLIAACATVASMLMGSTRASAQTLYSWSGSESQQTMRLTRDGEPSVWWAPKPFPGLEGPNTYLFQTFSFVNPYASATPFFVDMLESSGSGIGTEIGNTLLAAYLGAYDPTNLAANYLGDSGFSCAGDDCDALSFSVLAPASAEIILVATRLDGGTLNGGYFEYQASFADPSTVVPEPSTWALMAAGLAGVGGVARRRRSAA